MPENDSWWALNVNTSFIKWFLLCIRFFAGSLTLYPETSAFLAHNSLLRSRLLVSWLKWSTQEIRDKKIILPGEILLRSRQWSQKVVLARTGASRTTDFPRFCHVTSLSSATPRQIFFPFFIRDERNLLTWPGKQMLCSISQFQYSCNLNNIVIYRKNSSSYKLCCCITCKFTYATPAGSDLFKLFASFIRCTCIFDQNY